MLKKVGFIDVNGETTSYNPVTQSKIIGDILDRQIMEVYKTYAECVITLWGDDSEDYGIETNVFGAELGDMLLGWDDMRIIMAHKVPKNIVYEWYDMRTQSFYSERVKENIGQIKDFNLYHFYLFFKETDGKKISKPKKSKGN